MKIPGFYFGAKKTMEKSVVHKEKQDFKEFHWVLKNAHSHKFYEFSFDMDDFPNIRIRNIINLEETGLRFEDNKISGITMVSNVYQLGIDFYHTGDEKNIEIKNVDLFVNADPKDLWKNIPGDPGDIFYKPDDISYQGKFLDKKIVVTSKRGRSHAHEGKFREDDFAVNELPADWCIVSVSDGAGSAKAAREGSRVATASVNGFFNSSEVLAELDNNINIIYTPEDSTKDKDEARRNVIRTLYEGVLFTYTALDKTAIDHDLSIIDLHATLIFALVKKFSFGYIILSFGVGDCPVTLISTGFSEVQLLNRMDVGEFSGGTRFITMKDIFNDQMAARFSITCVNDFAYLVLMTDGIYDPKFSTENKLEDRESWRTFFNDLAGHNDDSAKVDFINDTGIDVQLSLWADFWSRGNHDDRTLAIIY